MYVKKCNLSRRLEIAVKSVDLVNLCRELQLEGPETENDRFRLVQSSIIDEFTLNTVV